MVTRRGARERPEDIRAAAEDALAFAGGLGEAAFRGPARGGPAHLPGAQERARRDRRGVKLLPPELTARHPGIDWRGWAGLRDVVAHRYVGLELPRLRPTVALELPALLAAVTAELARSNR